MPPKKPQLATRERTLFSRLVQEYETKKYKPALKTADAILSKVPNHGETLAIKGLVLCSLHRRDEGVQLAKLGLRYDLTSFICWHALGIIHRMDRNYEESLKCYAQALRIEGGNLNIVRESAFMQLQLRNYAPLIDARLVILRTQPHLRTNWLALAIAHDLADNKTQAVRVLAGFEDVCRNIPPHNYEYSEVVLYHASLLHDLGDAEGVLSLLEAQKGHIVDEPAADVLRGQALEKVGRREEAVAKWYSMVERNPDNKHWIAAYLDLVSTEATRLDKLVELQTQFPRSNAMRRMALDVAQGDAFRTHAKSYLERALVKNVPSLFSDVKSLYTQPGKQDVVEEIVESFRQTWDPRNAEAAQEPPSSYLFAMYFLAHHYSYTQRPALALQYIDSIVAHTPSMPELHMTRARVLKRCGAYEAAADAMEEARLLDGQDRYLNTKTAKYLLRVNKVDEAAKVLKLFTRPDMADPVVDLVDMQAIGYLVEDAEAHDRRGEKAMALKRFHQVDKIVQDIYDDQLDFHSYCLRKMTLRAYLRTIRFEDNVFTHPHYLRAARGAIAEYICLHEDTARSTVKPPKVVATGELDENTPPPDPDPRGEILAATETPLADAHHFVRKLELNAPKDIRTWMSVLDVALREPKWLLALRAISLAYQLDSSYPALHVQTIRLRQALDKAGELPAPVTNALATLSADVPTLSMPLQQLHTEYLQKAGGLSPAHTLAAAEGLYLMEGSTQTPQAAAELVHTILKQNAPLFVLEQARSLLARMETMEALPESVNAATFSHAAHEQWPHADAFLTESQRVSNAQQRQAARAKWLS